LESGIIKNELELKPYLMKTTDVFNFLREKFSENYSFSYNPLIQEDFEKACRNEGQTIKNNENKKEAELPETLEINTSSLLNVPVDLKELDEEQKLFEKSRNGDSEIYDDENLIIRQKEEEEMIKQMIEKFNYLFVNHNCNTDHVRNLESSFYFDTTSCKDEQEALYYEYCINPKLKLSKFKFIAKTNEIVMAMEN
jgi:hypothetical protein